MEASQLFVKEFLYVEINLYVETNWNHIMCVHIVQSISESLKYHISMYISTVQISQDKLFPFPVMSLVTFVWFKQKHLNDWLTIVSHRASDGRRMKLLKSNCRNLQSKLNDLWSHDFCKVHAVDMQAQKSDNFDPQNAKHFEGVEKKRPTRTHPAMAEHWWVKSGDLQQPKVRQCYGLPTARLCPTWQCCHCL